MPGPTNPLDQPHPRTPARRSARARHITSALGLLLVSSTAFPAAAQADFGRGDSQTSATISGYDIASAVYVEGPGITDTSGGKGRPTCTWTAGVFPGEDGSEPAPTGGNPNPTAFVPAQPGQAAHEEDRDGKKVRLYARDCGNGQQWYWVPVVTAEELAATAGDMVKQRVPDPKAVFSPNISAGNAAVVHLPLWFAVPAGLWGPVTATADVPGLTATAVARPVELRFQAGDHGAAKTCTGPGLQWRSGMREPARPPDCSYTYADASTAAPGGQAWAAQLSIRWHITWTATNGQGGDLGQMTTSTAYRVPVREVQAIEGSSR